MKTWFFFLLLTLIIGIVAGAVLGMDSGYVLLSFDKYSLETSLGMALVLVLVVVMGFYALLRLSLLLLGNDWQFQRWRRQRRNLKARKQTVQALLAMAQGQWRRAERSFGQAAADAEAPIINYFAAARAASEQGNLDDAMNWLNQASNSTRGAELAVSLMQAEMLNAHGQSEQALAILLGHYKKHHRHSYILKLLVKIYTELGDWQALHKILPDVSRYAGLSDAQLQQLAEKTDLQMLQKCANSSANELKECFNGLSRKQRYSLEIARHYIELLIGKNQEMAEQELRAILKNLWHDDLIKLYGTIKAEDASRQLLYAEKQLNERPNDPVLFLTLGRLAVRAKQTAKAEDYFAAGLRLRNLPELHQEMALLRLAEGDEARACEHFQLGLS